MRKDRVELEQTPAFGTQEKKNKYYSTQDYEGTVRKRLEDEFMQPEGKSKLGLSTTQQTHSSNVQLIDHLQQSIQNYHPQFSKHTPIKKMNYIETDFEELLHEPVPAATQNIAVIKEENEVADRLQEEVHMQAAMEMIDMPRRRVAHIDREISALYKENRNVNLEYRKEKFMQIFLNKPMQRYLQS